MKNYHHLYLKRYALLLAEKYRNAFCPSHYFSAPSFTCVVILSMTRIELDLISGVDRYLFFEKGIRGGVSYMYERYSKGNIKYLTSHDPKNPTKLLLFGQK